jgi:putative phosphoesterase
MKIGVVSDTHNFVDPLIRELFIGVEHILHAGDFGQPQVVQILEQIAPVTAVMGNVDDPGFYFPQTEVVELAGRKFLLNHIVNPHSLAESIRANIDREQPNVVVFGHTHKPFCETLDGVLYFNPGYAGKQRFNMSRSVGILHCDEKSIRAEHLPL